MELLGLPPYDLLSVKFLLLESIEMQTKKCFLQY